MHASGGWLRDPAKELEQGAFPGPIATQNPHHFSAVDLEGHIFQGPKFLLLFTQFPAPLPEPGQRMSRGPLNRMSQSIPPGSLVANDISLGELLNGYDRVTHRGKQKFGNQKMEIHFNVPDSSFRVLLWF